MLTCYNNNCNEQSKCIIPQKSCKVFLLKQNQSKTAKGQLLNAAIF